MVAVARCCQLVAPAAKGACVACTKTSESVGVVLSAGSEVSCCAAAATSAAVEAAEAVVAENLYAGFDLGAHDGGNQQRRRTK